jgi:hypothetical protein
LEQKRRLYHTYHIKSQRLHLCVCVRVGISVYYLCMRVLAQTLDVGGEAFLALAIAYSQGMAQGLSPAPLPPAPPRHAGGMTGKALVLGYLSSDFTAHATTHLLKGVFALHALRRVDTVCLDLRHAASAAVPTAAASSSAKGDGSVWHNEVAQVCQQQ